MFRYSQEKVPHYQRVFENVDMDEVRDNECYYNYHLHACTYVCSFLCFLTFFFQKDGEINVAELDFALKAVNYNLISDAELLFVNKVYISIGLIIIVVSNY